ncbi:cell division protein [Rossellomorea aquimaris]|uniref:cell division FtsA domain-containing protein n=1 Tax=Rossellomorea aquimaris TaxID=189382 RepID=UPI001CD46FB2|nr:cell division FtsA domain-containing protein [Rossellomorea aquimaris]MCA1056874.1 cell division protein [Rossellomorea aquimaris]
MYNLQKIFSLDIGTRSVVGIILEERDGKYHVIDIEVEEHKERAMLDGQIHDVPAVSEVITSIKQKLEQKQGTLHKVCVAAAGRALKTEKSIASFAIKGKPLLTKEDILHLELTAVQKAQAQAAESEKDSQSYHYYCVGYSVLYYHLDGEEIGSLVDQQGNEASVEVIATFLPRVVVESLLAALNRADLEMEALTLEPIAAINVLIPPSMRRLNVALVDIGAGTSDIALTNKGTITAYGMVPTAGDEITEALSDALLLDFPLAEKAKRDLYRSDTISVTDILGFDSEIPSNEVVEKIFPAISNLAKKISHEILLLNNQKPPQAVMLVGGGSLTPQLPRELAKSLSLPENRVAVRGIEAIQNLSITDILAKGPELVTPVGIAIAAKQSPVQYVTIHVNDQPIRLFEVKDLTIGDGLLAAGIKINKLYGKPGSAYFITVNGQDVTLPGGYGHPPTIYKNGQEVSVDDKLMNHDRITVIKGEDGASPHVRISDLIDETPDKTVIIDGNSRTISPVLKKNGAHVKADCVIEDGDKIQYVGKETITDVLRKSGHEDWLEHMKPFRLTINGKETYFPSLGGKVLLNGMEARPSSSVSHLDTLTVEPPKQITVGMILSKRNEYQEKSIKVLFNGSPVILRQSSASVYKEGKPLNMVDTVHSGDSITIEETVTQPFIFQDLFKHVEVNKPDHANTSFQLIRNGEETTFYGEIHAGDSLEIRWTTAHEK